MQHYAVNDRGDAKRVVRRTTLDGGAPASIDGRRSVNLKKTIRYPARAA